MTPSLSPEEQTEADPSLIIPPGFERYFGDRVPEIGIIGSTDLLPDLEGIKSSQAKELFNHLEVLQHLELITPEGSSRRDVVKEGNTSIVVVCREEDLERRRNPLYGSLAVIGGTGIYDTPSGETPIVFALRHTDLLSAIMSRKCLMAGLELGGMKATIPGESDWEKSRWLRVATGFLFSPQGPFFDAITGTDARQTPETIADMALGSEIGGGYQIAGLIPELDTPSCCRFSLAATYKELRKQFGEEGVPELRGARVLIEGFGRIGYTAARLMLDKGAVITISDPLLTGENNLLPPSIGNSPDLERRREVLKRKLANLQQEYGKERVMVVPTTELDCHQGQVFCPCSTAEGSVTKARIERLADNGVRVILSGANNPFGEEEAWERASLAASLGILVPPEILANCGSVTAAAMEPLLRPRLWTGPATEIFPTKILSYNKSQAERFLQEVVIPHITSNTAEKLRALRQIMVKEGIDLYNAAVIYCQRTRGAF